MGQKTDPTFLTTSDGGLFRCGFRLGKSCPVAAELGFIEDSKDSARMADVDYPVRVAVVGGGISGLTAAFYLQRLAGTAGVSLACTLLEQDDRLGGVIRTERVDGLVLEAGPEGWASYKHTALRLLEDLGLKDQLLGSNDRRRRTWVARQGRLTALPDGMMFLAPVNPLAFWRSAPLSWFGKLRASCEPLVPRSTGELSVRQFFERRLGPEFTRELVEPLISAIYGGDFERLSTPSALPELYRAEQRAGSLWRGLRRFARMTRKTSVLYTLREGMSQMIDRLTAQLDAVRIQTGVRGLRLHRDGEAYRLCWESGQEAADFVVLAVPAPAAARILSSDFPAASSALSAIPYGSSTLVYLAYRKSEFNHPLDGFGFIVPSNEPQFTDACTWVNTKFDFRAPDDLVLLRCAVHRHGAGTDLPEEESAARCHRDIAELMEVSCKPVFSRVYQVRGAIPQLLMGHSGRVQSAVRALRDHPKVVLAGSYVGGVGVPDCIRTGREAAESILRRLESRRKVQTAAAVRALRTGYGS